jgi:hypothetical protein
MHKNVADIITLTTYLGIDSIHQSWHAPDYANIVAAVKKTLSEKHRIDYHTGLEVSWSIHRPERLAASVNGVMVANKQYYYDEWPLNEEIGEKLVADLKLLAHKKAALDIERERQERLRQEAESRVAELLKVSIVCQTSAFGLKPQDEDPSTKRLFCKS